MLKPLLCQQSSVGDHLTSRDSSAAGGLRRRSTAVSSGDCSGWAKQPDPHPAPPSPMSPSSDTSPSLGWCVNEEELGLLLILQSMWSMQRVRIQSMQRRTGNICFFNSWTGGFAFENHWQTSSVEPHNEMFTVLLQRETALGHEVEVCWKSAEQGMRKGRELKHDGAVGIQHWGEKTLFILLMFLHDWRDDPFHLWFLG